MRKKQVTIKVSELSRLIFNDHAAKLGISAKELVDNMAQDLLKKGAK